VPPFGPPDVIVLEQDSPDISAGQAFDVQVAPVMASGEYHVYVILYMEGGGEWMPTFGVDYVGVDSPDFSFDGTPVNFGDIPLEISSLW